LDKELLVSGPNASGKTTVLKTTLFNIICSQQLGVGFYKKANIKVYSNIFCYLNIPDTSGRDSLFQAEARRCVDILNRIAESPQESTFCIFDELYSGTNHYEAISSAYSFLTYLVKNHNFHFMMSTHFIDLCVKLEKNNDKIGNMKMDVTQTGDDFIYGYKLKPGISDVKGGVKVLKDLNYPDEIVANTKKFLDTEF
jgi:DNA mismatch repair ATPase MutS